ncbi:FliG C-terminal domain-containing protein [Halocynthiibacter styelae]|uniref:Flagellar motor switch protein FliG n=1 Tax=Halocynthiibacter styelae TaxID=2761955 RepID=A0A8J7IJB7_9RHOB|nr:FliG C-terminal domain-containing protein [Paenihalocynthiibacter styelae]MBI1494048.1 flagellar motor switch protein FliG [Paenihalocynthiibacter styelae]
MPDGLPGLPLPPPLPAIGGQGHDSDNLPVVPQLPQSQKAAILVRLLLNEDIKLPLQDLPESCQVLLTEHMASMRIVKREISRDVAKEFLRELVTIGLTNSRGLEGALSDLEGVINETTIQKMRREIGLKAISDPWLRLERLENEKLRNMLMCESTEIAAVVLSKLSVSRAAELLSSLPGDIARRITWAMSMTGTVSPDAIERIGLSLASQLDSHAPMAFEEAAENRVGAILNQAKAAVRDDLLESLEDEDREFAREVRRSIFTFAHIATRLDPMDVTKILRDVETGAQIDAFAFATTDPESDNAKTVEFMLTQMSSRLADSLREDMEARGEVKEEIGEAAMGKIVSELRRLADADEIVLLEIEEEETEKA